jgi:hypothetical protein
LISKINHQEPKPKEHLDKEVKEVEEVAKEVDAVVKEVDVVEIEADAVVKEVDAVVKEVDVVEIEEAVAEAEIEVKIEVLKAEEAVLDQELLLMLMMKEMKFLKKFIEKDNPIKKILMLLITVMKKDQELVEAVEVKRKTVMEKVTGETDQKDNIKRRVVMLRQWKKLLKLP